MNEPIEEGNRLFLTEHERQWLLASNAEAAAGLEHQMAELDASDELKAVWGRDVMPSEQPGAPSLPPDIAKLLRGES